MPKLSECKNCNKTIQFNGHSWRHIISDTRLCNLRHNTNGAPVKTIFTTQKVKRFLRRSIIKQTPHYTYKCYKCNRQVSESEWLYDYCNQYAVPRGK